MTLLDAPEFDYTRDRRRRKTLITSAALLFVFLIAFWLAAGHPVDYPWYWGSHLRGRIEVNAFFKALEKNDMAAAYGVWIHDKDWQKHPDKHSGYTFERFQKDWSPQSPDSDYGAIHSHRIAAATMHGNVLQVGIFVNERKSNAINLDYDPKDHTLNFSPEDVQFLEGPGGIS
ncbi:MAG: hypothetical protein WAN35_04210 [Terracidiphilus sp.]